MKQLCMHEIRRVQLRILDEVVNFCEKNNIKYWLDSGTMLGAVRHNGYIPWDDDIDLGMLREDYDKLIYNFNNCIHDSRYVLESVETNPECRFPFAKVYDKTTILYEEDIKLSINIDVFVYDNAPNNFFKYNWMYLKRNLFNRFNACQWGNGIQPKNIIKRLMRKILYWLLKLFPKNYFASKVINNSKRYAACDTAYVGNFTAATKVLLKKSWVEDVIKFPFEGKEYNIPNCYDAWLKAFYGDYMKLPPEDERVGKHNIRAYQK